MAHTLLIQALRTAEEENSRDGVVDKLRDRYVERVAAVDLDAEAVSMLIGWITDRLETGKPIDTWLRALRSACADRGLSHVMSGTPALVRALCEKAATQPLAIHVLSDRLVPPNNLDEVMKTVKRLEEKIEEQAGQRGAEALASQPPSGFAPRAGTLPFIVRSAPRRHGRGCPRSR